MLAERNRFVENRAFSVTVDSKDEDTVYDRIKNMVSLTKYSANGCIKNGVKPMTIKQFHMKLLWAIIHPELFLLPYGKKKSSKLTVHFDLYEILKSDLSGFYNTVTPLKNINIKFTVLDSSQNIVYTSPNNIFTNDTIIELPNGEYTIKLLFSIYGFAGGEEQAVTVNGETVYTIKLYKRHFKAMTVNDDYDTYNGTMLSYYFSGENTAQADEVIGISQINVYELKWDKWEKILNYNCVPQLDSNIVTHSERITDGARDYKTQYFNGYITSRSGFAVGGWFPGPYSEKFIGWEDGKMVIVTTRGNNTSTNKVDALNTWFDSLNYIYNAVMLYHDGKIYEGKDSIDDDFFLKYKGKSLLKHQVETTSNMYVLADPRNPPSLNPMSFIKIYLPTINYFNEELLKERKNAEQNGNLFWNTSLKAVKINENGVVKSYDSKMIYNWLEVAKINSISLAWYSDNYDQYT